MVIIFAAGEDGNWVPNFVFLCGFEGSHPHLIGQFRANGVMIGIPYTARMRIRNRFCGKNVSVGENIVDLYGRVALPESMKGSR